MTVFDELQERAFLVLLAQHGETVSVRGGAGGDSRDVQVLVTESDEHVLQYGLDREVETILVDCFRDEEHARGGIRDPQLGLILLRAGETRHYGFSGDVTRRSPTTVRLAFQRPRLDRVGTAHRQQSGQ